MAFLPPGIRNEGNICYASCILHLLRVFVKVLDYARLPYCGECSHGNESMPCTDFVSILGSVSGSSASGHHSQKCIVGALEWAENIL